MPLLQIAKDGPITTLTIDRAETMNPLGAAGDGDEFTAACTAINRDYDTRCVILTGAGRAFSAGGDIKAMRDKTGGFGGATPTLGNRLRCAGLRAEADLIELFSCEPLNRGDGVAANPLV